MKHVQKNIIFPFFLVTDSNLILLVYSDLLKKLKTLNNISSKKNYIYFVWKFCNAKTQQKWQKKILLKN